MDRTIQKKQLQYRCCVAVYYVEDILVEQVNVELKTENSLKCIKRIRTKKTILKIMWAAF
jgi:hypothetical protein